MTSRTCTELWFDPNRLIKHVQVCVEIITIYKLNMFSHSIGLLMIELLKSKGTRLPATDTIISLQ